MKILIVDDHSVVREGVAALLLSGFAGSCVLEAHDCARGLDIVDEHADVDIVVLDLGLPGMGGMSAIPEFGRRRPALPVIVLSSSENAHDVKEALALGALGYVPKSASRQTLLDAMEFVLKGHVYVPPFTLLPDTAPVAANEAVEEPPPHLTTRQLEVLKLLSRGLSNKEIGNTLDLSEKTVKVHITSIFRSLHVINRTQAASAARQGNLI